MKNTESKCFLSPQRKSTREGVPSWKKWYTCRLATSAASSSMFDFFFEALYFLSKINNLEEEKHVAMSYEVVDFLADGLFVDFISDLS